MKRGEQFVDFCDGLVGGVYLNFCYCLLLAVVYCLELFVFVGYLFFDVVGVEDQFEVELCGLYF